MSPKNNYFWQIIETFNELMRSAIIGPDCTDPNICNGACCSIKIDVPKVLAEEYIRRKYATKEDFIRSNIFSFVLRFNNKTGKCFLFDKELNGCKVHNSGIKPPQCWIYPTGFLSNGKRSISCKKLSGWKIQKPKKALEAEKILEVYNFVCKVEAKHEMKKINERLGVNLLKKNNKNLHVLSESLRKLPPCKLAGVKDKWDNFDILNAKGYSLQMKKFCLKYNKECKFLPDDFMECKAMCNRIIDQLILFLQNNLFNFIKKEGLDVKGEYPLYKLFNFVSF